MSSLKEHYKSFFITFSSTFVLTLLSMFNTIDLNSLERSALISILIAAARAALKVSIEGASTVMMSKPDNETPTTA